MRALYTSPTLLRALQAHGDEWVKKSDLSSLKILGTVGEPINPAAWEWFFKVVGKSRCPIVDTWWQVGPPWRCKSPSSCNLGTQQRLAHFLVFHTTQEINPVINMRSSSLAVLNKCRTLGCRDAGL